MISLKGRSHRREESEGGVKGGLIQKSHKEESEGVRRGVTQGVRGRSQRGGVTQGVLGFRSFLV